jgi:hypothetical protein
MPYPARSVGFGVFFKATSTLLSYRTVHRRSRERKPHRDREREFDIRKVPLFWTSVTTVGITCGVIMDIGGRS